jgi:hypothetical protein
MRKFINCFLIFFIFSLSNSLAQEYILLGWNDLGMHCANQDFSKMAVLPPFNNVYAQLILKMPNQNPQIVKNGYSIEYSIPGNTYSVGKTNFWTYAQQLFGLPQPLPPNIGLTGKGLTGVLDTGSNNFSAVGIPVTPYSDNNLVNENPFQLFHLNAKQNGTLITFTENVIPVSNEIGCVQSGCHNSQQAIMNSHPNVTGFDPNQPTLCANCHASNALGTIGIPEAKPFSFRMHDTHAFIQPGDTLTTCYKCHPGPNTQCLRDVMRMNFHLVCQNCHGTMQIIANSIDGGRRPWLDEPRCITCHGTNFAEEPGKIFKQSRGHGGLMCSSCHGSPHAIVPSREANDNAQNIRLQGHQGTLSDCMVCHSSPPAGPGPHGIFIGVRPIGNKVPSVFKLAQNFPNPFNPSTKIRFDIPVGGTHQSRFIHIVVYDILGREVKTLVNIALNAGTYETDFNALSLSSGLYFYSLFADGSKIDTKKMVLVR